MRRSIGADTSVTGWQLMALKSGEFAGLKCRRQTYTRVKQWLDAAQASKADGSQYVYNPVRPGHRRSTHGRSRRPR